MRPVGTELFRADGRTDMTKLIVAFRNFANSLKEPPNYYVSACLSVTLLYPFYITRRLT